MARTLTIQSVYSDISKREQVGKPGKFLFLKWDGYAEVRYRVYAFRIQYPDGEEKYVEYDKKKYRWNGSNYYLDEDDVDFTARSKVLQNIVNELEDEGYFVENEILSRFMNWKISMMIMQKRGK